MTSYNILVSTVNGDWHLAPVEMEARDGVHAVRKYATEHPIEVGKEEAVYVPIPTRNWKPMAVQTNTVQTIRIVEHAAAAV